MLLENTNINKKLKIIIVEDEQAASNILKYMLEKLIGKHEIIDIATGVNEAYKKIITHKPDLVFLDIKLSDGTAFNLLELFDKIDFAIIFTTAYNNYAIKAIKYSAIDYLLKPIDPLELRKATQKAIKMIEQKEKYNEMLDVLNNYLKNDIKKIFLNTNSGKCSVLVNDIIRLEADGAYTIFVLADKKITVSKNIKFYQELLDEDVFIRTHQSHLVNITKVIGYESEGYVILSNQEKIPVSVRKRQLIKNFFFNK